MKNLLIIGARGWGREVYGMLPHCLGYGSDYIIKGFLDDKRDALDDYANYPPIIDSVEHYQPQENDVFICALGEPKWKHHYSQIILAKGGRFISIIHNNASIGTNTIIGQGCILSKDISISCDVSIGDFVTIQRLATIGHDAKIGDFCNIGAITAICGFVSIGEESIIYPGATILPHIKIENNCVIGAGAVVVSKVKEATTVFGNPAKRMKF